MKRMERFLLKKLIVISDEEKASYETEFEKGLNVVIGANKTGKSSIIKSIFYTLGCDTDMESSWKKLISTYMLFFYYGNEKFCLIRQNKKYRLYKTNENDSQFLLLCNAENYADYTNYLLKKIFKIDAELISKKGETVSFIPPVLFRFQYIDQDGGWRKLGESFTNVSYIKDWRKYSIKFIIGYQGEEYYKFKKQIDIIGNKIGELKIKHNHFSELFDSMKESISNKNESKIEGSSIDELKEKADKILSDLSIFEREKVGLNEKISSLRNEIYEKTLELNVLKKSLEHIDKDHEFALNQEDTIKCPICGMIYDNSISERIELVKDMQSGEELLNGYKTDIEFLQNNLNEMINNRHALNRNISEFKIQFQKIKESIDIPELYKEEGRKEIINVSEHEREKISKEIEVKEFEKVGYELDVKGLESRKRMNKIKNDFIAIYQNVLEKVNIGNTYIKLTNFVQKLENTGSERPRIILSYHLALYLYNLGRGTNLYNWLVIDTPNQQGQDAKNLKNIDSLIDLMLAEKGQVIIGTERKTGYEKSANKIIQLTEYKRCLNSEIYSEHKELLYRLDNCVLL